MDRIRLGKFPFLNCVPVYYALERGIVSQEVPFKLVTGVPAQMNDFLKKGRVDLAPISSIAYLELKNEVFLLPQLSISATGKVQSVMLFSRLPIEKLHRKTIFLTSHSATSSALLKLILKECFGIEPIYQTGELIQLNGQGIAGLAIGDAALKLKAKRLYPYQYDLAEMWQAWTDLPFVFGLFAVRKRAWQDDSLKRLYGLLLESKKWGKFHLGKLAKMHQREGIDLFEYWKNLNYDLSPLHLKGLQKFLQLTQKNQDLIFAPGVQF